MKQSSSTSTGKSRYESISHSKGEKGRPASSKLMSEPMVVGGVVTDLTAMGSSAESLTITSLRWGNSLWRKTELEESCCSTTSESSQGATTDDGRDCRGLMRGLAAFFLETDLGMRLQFMDCNEFSLAVGMTVRALMSLTPRTFDWNLNAASWSRKSLIRVSGIGRMLLSATSWRAWLVMWATPMSKMEETKAPWSSGVQTNLLFLEDLELESLDLFMAPVEMSRNSIGRPTDYANVQWRRFSGCGRRGSRDSLGGLPVAHYYYYYCGCVCAVSPHYSLLCTTRPTLSTKLPQRALPIRLLLLLAVAASSRAGGIFGRVRLSCWRRWSYRGAIVHSLKQVGLNVWLMYSLDSSGEHESVILQHILY